jgi:hypothetical protein
VTSTAAERFSRLPRLRTITGLLRGGRGIADFCWIGSIQRWIGPESGPNKRSTRPMVWFGDAVDDHRPVVKCRPGELGQANPGGWKITEEVTQ